MEYLNLFIYNENILKIKETNICVDMFPEIFMKLLE